MANKPIPTVKVLRQLIRCEPETGKLFWLFRDKSWFARESYATRWNSVYAGKEAFTSLGADGYRVGAVLAKPLLAHRVIWGVVTGMWPKGQIDHINGDRLDNRIENLRDIPAAENSRNRKSQHNSVTGVSGVTWHPRDEIWQARIGVNGKRRHLGYFTSFEDAVGARKDAEREFLYHANHSR